MPATAFRKDIPRGGGDGISEQNSGDSEGTLEGITFPRVLAKALCKKVKVVPSVKKSSGPSQWVIKDSDLVDQLM